MAAVVVATAVVVAATPAAAPFVAEAEDVPFKVLPACLSLTETAFLPAGLDSEIDVSSVKFNSFPAVSVCVNV